MKSGIAFRLTKFAASLLVASISTFASQAIAGSPPKPPDPCQWIPNPAYEPCKIAVGCNLGPLGGTYCKISNVSFCNRVTDPAKVAEDVAKIAAMAAICSVVPGTSQIPGITGAALGQAAAACGTATVGAKPQEIQDGFCKDFIDSVPKKLCGPEKINTCPWKN